MSYDGSSIEIIVSWKLSCTILLGLGLMKVFLTVDGVATRNDLYLSNCPINHFQGFRTSHIMPGPFIAISSICFRGPWTK